jgi:serine/threonine-protein kinase SRPK3
MLLHTAKGKFVPEFVPTILEDRLRRLEAVDENEIAGVAGFLRRCLTLDPKLRPSAQELLEDRWLL